MELDNIIWIIVWAFIIVYSLISSKNNKAKAQQRQKRAPQRPVEIAQPPQPKAVQTQKGKERLATLADTLASNAQKTSKIQEAETPSWRSELPAEGERVTASAVQDEEPAASEISTSGESWLKDKDNLKKALIFGQILQPKF